MPTIDAIQTLQDLQLHFSAHLPHHLGLILDGNRRWAQRQGITDPTKGHLAGYNKLKTILKSVFDAGIHYLTVYALSLENIKKRSPREIQFLFELLLGGVNEVLQDPTIKEHEVQVRLIGQLHVLPESIQQQIQLVNREIKPNPQNFINFCIVYDGQEELVDAMKTIVREQVPFDQITKATIKRHLYTKDFPELDYIIRTGMDDGARISGFLLWDSSYAEFRFRMDLWPDYSEQMLLEDLKEYIHRKRRKGA